MMDHHQYAVVDSILTLHAKIFQLKNTYLSFLFYMNLLVLNKSFLVKYEYSLKNKQHDFEYDLNKNMKSSCHYSSFDILPPILCTRKRSPQLNILIYDKLFSVLSSIVS